MWGKDEEREERKRTMRSSDSISFGGASHMYIYTGYMYQVVRLPTKVENEQQYRAMYNSLTNPITLIDFHTSIGMPFGHMNILLFILFKASSTFVILMSR